MKYLMNFAVLVLIFGTSCSSSPSKNSSSFQKFEFLQIKSGSFQMGSPDKELHREDNEILHLAKIPRDFEIQKTPLTQYQWYLITGKNPSRFKEKKHCPSEYLELKNISLCPNHPVERVSWDDVQTFIFKLNRNQKKFFYRLPTEAEWEYATRAGTLTSYFFGAESQNLNQYAWFEDPSPSTHPQQTSRVGSKKANPFGLYDVYGNIWEWVGDFYSPDLKTQTDYRVIRGGSWNSEAHECRSARRQGWSSARRNSDIGFRLVRIKML
jgi:formylglycine-generating enzyme required for sulfatase activity